MEEQKKYASQIKPRQISQLEKDKSTQKLAEKIDKGLQVHSMPNNFKSGKFDYSVHPSDIGKTKEKKVSTHKHKKTGLLILFIGILVLGALGYAGYMFMFPGSTTNVSVNEPIEQTKPVDSVVKNEVVDVDEVVEPVDEIETDIEDTASSTDVIVIDDMATSTDVVIDDDTATSTDVVFVVDTDQDGLTDAEEMLLGTNINLADSDSDTYEDKSEVLNLYNPAGTNMLADNPAIETYINDSYNYELIYPKAWEVKVVDSGSSVMFMNDSEGFYQISVEPNVENLNINDWYIKEFSLEELPDDQYFVDESRELVFSPDGFLVYLTDSNQQRVFTLSYVSLSPEPAYFQIFSALVQSFKLQ